MEIDWAALNVGWNILVTLVAGAACVFAWASNRHRVTHDHVKAIDESVGTQLKGVDDRFDRHAHRITKLEGKVEHLPTAEQVAGVQSSVEGLRGAIQGLKATVDGIKDSRDVMRKSISRIEEHLLTKKDAP